MLRGSGQGRILPPRLLYINEASGAGIVSY